MSAIRRGLWVGVAGLAVALAAPAAPAQEKGTDISQGFRAYVVQEPRFPAEDIRNRTGKIQDLVTDHGLNPVVAVFSRSIHKDANSPLGALVAKLDDLASEEGWKDRRLGAFVVFLALGNEFRKDDSRDTRIQEIAQFAAGVMPKRVTMGLAEATVTPDEGAQPLVPAQVQAMGIGPDDDLVIVFYDRFHVVKRWAFPRGVAPGDAELAAIEAEVEKRLGPRKKGKK